MKADRLRVRMIIRPYCSSASFFLDTLASYEEQITGRPVAVLTTDYYFWALAVNCGQS